MINVLSDSKNIVSLWVWLIGLELFFSPPISPPLLIKLGFIHSLVAKNKLNSFKTVFHVTYSDLNTRDVERTREKRIIFDNIFSSNDGKISKYLFNFKFKKDGFQFEIQKMFYILK